MASIDLPALERALNLLPSRFRGPGGVAGVARDGEIVATRSWGFADMEHRIPMTEKTRLPICSISKQFTCALLLDLFEDPSSLDQQVRHFLPHLNGPLPTVEQLCHNQSGLRDYWALSVLQGAFPETEFRREDALPLIARAKTGHFPPGKLYSYNNANFRILAELIERNSGKTFSELLQERLFAPAGMSTAVLVPDARQPLDSVIGYEGNDEIGFLPARNGVYWFGDSGISAALTDLLAWECHIDATRNDVGGLYNRLSAPVTYSDGSPAAYGYGLRRDVWGGVRITGHGGGVRGFSSYRLHAADERLSIVVMFNHDTSTFSAATFLMEAALGLTTTPTENVKPEGWDGLWLDEDQELLLRTVEDAAGIRLYYGPATSRLTVGADGVARGHGLTLEKHGDRLRMDRKQENLQVTARPLCRIAWADPTTLAGNYWSEELEAGLEIEARGGAAHVVFSGMLGQGPMERMYAVADDLWIVTSRRSIDTAPPGDWTVRVRRDESGAITGLALGCWLARSIDYRRIP